MAGIGFKLNKLLQQKTYSNLLQAYGYAALISSGPWVLSVLILALLGAVLIRFCSSQDLAVFFSSVTHVYAFTLVFTSPVQLLVTRYYADLHYMGEVHRGYSSLLAVMVWIAPVFGLAGLIFFVGFVPAPLQHQLAAAFLTMLVAGVWMMSVYVTAMENYSRVVLFFGIGYGTGFLLAWLFTYFFGHSYAMLGFALGHLVLFILLLSAIRHELGGEWIDTPGMWASFKKYQNLAWVGFLYNLGIWSDKFLFWWFSPERIQTSGALYASPIYDQAVYISFLTVAPGMAFFLMKLETEFAEKFKEFFDKIQQKASFSELCAVKDEMATVLRESVMQLVKIQGAITFSLLFFCDRLMPFLGLKALQAGIFQLVLLGAFLLVIFLSVLTVLFYLDKRNDALLACAVFCVVNIVGTLTNIFSGLQWYGLGFVLAVASALIVVSCQVNYRLNRLEFETFTLQPIYPD